MAYAARTLCRSGRYAAWTLWCTFKHLVHTNPVKGAHFIGAPCLMCSLEDHPLTRPFNQNWCIRAIKSLLRYAISRNQETTRVQTNKTVESEK